MAAAVSTAPEPTIADCIVFAAIMTSVQVIAKDCAAGERPRADVVARAPAWPALSQTAVTVICVVDVVAMSLKCLDCPVCVRPVEEVGVLECVSSCVPEMVEDILFQI